MGVRSPSPALAAKPLPAGRVWREATPFSSCGRLPCVPPPGRFRDPRGDNLVTARTGKQGAAPGGTLLNPHPQVMYSLRH